MILLIRVHAIWFEKKLILALLLAAYIVITASSVVSWLDEEENFSCSQLHPWRIISQSGQQGQQIPVSTQALIKLFSKLSCFQS